MSTIELEASDVARIGATIDDWAGALRAKDAAGVVARHGPDYLQFSLAPPLQHSNSDAEGLDSWFATWDGPLGYEIHDREIAVGGDVAFCHGLVRLCGTKRDGESVDLWFRLTLGLRRTGGEWKIIHEHESVPFYMDGSYKAAIDLHR